MVEALGSTGRFTIERKRDDNAEVVCAVLEVETQMDHETAMRSAEAFVASAGKKDIACFEHIKVQLASPRLIATDTACKVASSSYKYRVSLPAAPSAVLYEAVGSLYDHLTSRGMAVGMSMCCSRN